MPELKSPIPSVGLIRIALIENTHLSLIECGWGNTCHAGDSKRLWAMEDVYEQTEKLRDQAKAIFNSSIGRVTAIQLTEPPKSPDSSDAGEATNTQGGNQ